MTLAQVNYLNIGLMLLSCALAYLLPFELFLFSYAVLGPLHYLTEIGWLHKRNYFTTAKSDYKWLLVLGAFAAILFILHQLVVYDFINIDTLGGSDKQLDLVMTLRMWIVNIIILAFIWGLSSTIFKSLTSKLSFTLIATGLLLLVSDMRPMLVALAALLPTLIHTTIFMLAFILYGSIKSKSISGYISVAVFIGCCIAIFTFQPIWEYQINARVLDSFMLSDFDELHASIVKHLGLSVQSTEALIYSPLGITVQRFFAFSYTYHYLNWFSKTHVISWHEVSTRWLIISAILWIGSVGLYLYDFTLGLTILFLLSLLHVFLEFPLNYKSLFGIYQSLTKGIGVSS